MNEESIKIVTDSSADITDLGEIPFESVPLKIITDKKEYVDDKNLDVDRMVEDLANYSGTTSTSCPSPTDWLSGFGNAKNVFCVSITGALSGSYNSARIAKSDYEEEHPGRNVFVLDSLSAGPEIRLIAEKIKELILGGKSFKDICTEIEEYRKHTGLLFMLESMKNLANNGRVSPLVAKMAGLLGIRVIGKASDVGTLETLDKCRGERKNADGTRRILKRT